MIRADPFVTSNKPAGTGSVVSGEPRRFVAGSDPRTGPGWEVVSLTGDDDVRTDLLDRLLVTLAVRLRAFSVCRIQRGWQLAFSPFEAITVHYVLRGTGSL